ncbi:MFS general substrate transporter [Dichomitus squalens]|uniref:MFS general substrate transporter n=1 Tax=Dichomitus squalens TaxID=114155 RepID=A0A4Q9MDN8_9APHY|nr:MFS general substrate transporter [Dichomitus squalens]
MSDKVDQPLEDIITFEHDDPDDPKNWSVQKKHLTVALASLYAFSGIFGSAFYAPGEPELREKYGVSADVSSLGLTLYVLGFGLGPLYSSTACSAFIPNIAAILVFRFISGCATAAALTNGPAVMADLYPHDLRGLGRSTRRFALCAFTAPCLATLFGFFVAARTHGSWVLKVQFFFSVAIWPLFWVFPETYSPKILAQRASALRKSGRVNAVAAHEMYPMTMKDIIHGRILRPFKMILYEPILQGATIWISITYGILYFYFEMYSVVFFVQHDIPFELCGLMFLFVLFGMVLSVVTFDTMLKISERMRIPVVERIDPGLPAEETQLKIVIPACLLLPASLFWFAWSSGPGTHWIVPALAGIPFGYATLSMFFAFTAYVSRTFTLYASSASSANTIVRSIIAAIFPVVAHTITDNVGTEWGISIFGFISLALIPIPFIFVRYGPELRDRSRYAREARQLAARLHRP